LDRLVHVGEVHLLALGARVGVGGDLPEDRLRIGRGDPVRLHERLHDRDAVRLRVGDRLLGRARAEDALLARDLEEEHLLLARQGALPPGEPGGRAAAATSPATPGFCGSSARRRRRPPAGWFAWSRMSTPRARMW